MFCTVSHLDREYSWEWRYIHFVILHAKDISRRAWWRDIKLLSLLGFIAGLKGFYDFILSSFFSLCFFGAGLVLKRMKMRTQIPFGPFISLGAICYMLVTYAK